MKIFILCGGSGERMRSYSFPKPLNMIYGKPAIYYSLKYIPAKFKSFHFIYAKHLCEYNFEQVILSLFKDRVCTFKCIDYFTRGPVETAYIGLKDSADDDEPIMILDNDNIYRFPDTFDPNEIDAAFIGCNIDKSGSEAFSFVQVAGSRIINIKEKQRISDVYCTGIYGFRNLRQFKEVAESLLLGEIKSEVYMSSLYERMILDSVEVKCLMFPMISHIGSLKEMSESLPSLGIEKIRVCFDLDNTLVTYPTIPGDYMTVSPIEPMISLARQLHEEGHTIIIYTARRMKTHSGNVGAVMKDVGVITFNTLAEFNIPYDEIIFGKPIADIYIDDRAVNPYRGDLRSMGLFHINEDAKVVNCLPSNKHNSICLRNGSVHKTGNKKLLGGQLFFYRNIPRDVKIHEYFPKLLNGVIGDDLIQMDLEYIRGIPFYTLFKNKMLTETHLSRLLDMVEIMHHTKSPTVCPTAEQIANNYIEKFKRRLSDTNLYPFANCETVRSEYLKILEEFCAAGRFAPVQIIHGDLWFSNIILEFGGDIKMIDMRGEVDGILTLGGDAIYDYAKLYQSLRGYDAILYGDEYDESYAQPFIGAFKRHLERIRMSIDDVCMISDLLILGTFHAIDDGTIREKVWNWITQPVS